MSFCTNCGNELAAGARFCGTCGKEQVADKTQCSKCGKELDEFEKFCSGCGIPITAKNKPEKETKKPANQQPKEEKFTKEGRKIITGGPKAVQPKKAPAKQAPKNTIKKKKRSPLGCFFRTFFILIAIVFGAALLIIVVNVLFVDEDGADVNSEMRVEKEVNDGLSDTNIPGIVDFKKGDVSHLPENRNKTAQKDATGTKKIVLDPNDNSSADKYRYGIDVDPDPYKALDYYEHLVSKGDPNAMVQLADYYEQGIWVEKNTKKATELLKRAAEYGSVQADWELEYLRKNRKN
ncbi:zinc-ribbon domain-containing protein [uncultured Draconibacterium sp.]|uniref:zinc-ribbon domain-containing protein n=1 Tax=uncultured Draconibacterium sp. TaxID=1573823 RepID=UPI0029C945FB|nr:zinc-ribbon domain-containing protein [uncultured Draconibacterium sp.]